MTSNIVSLITAGPALSPPIGWSDIAGILPALILIVAGAVTLGVDLFLKDSPPSSQAGGKFVLSFLSLLGAAVAGAMIVAQLGSGSEEPRTYFLDAIRVDRFSSAMALLIVLGTAVALLGAGDALRRRGLETGEFHALVLFAAASMVLFAQSASLVMVFLSLETLSMAVYVLTAFVRDDKRSLEGGLKYFILGGLSSGFLLLGLAFIYGGTRSLNLVEIAAQLAAAKPDVDPSLLVAGLGLTLIGLAFKIGAFPFHAWVPDAYEGAMSVVTAFMATTVKVASFAVVLRLALLFGGATAPGLESHNARKALIAGLSALAVVTMIYGNLVAIAQSSAKRMLAYSAIAHTGYLLVGVVAAMDQGTVPGGGTGAAVLFYLFPYALMSLGAFLSLSHLGEGAGDRESIDSLRGLSRRHPVQALAILLLMISFVGIPPTAGFWAKFYIFRQALETGHWGLAITGIAASIVSVYYYLSLVVAMYMHPGEDEPPLLLLESRTGGKIAIAVAVIGVVVVGLLPETFFNLSLKYSLP